MQATTSDEIKFEIAEEPETLQVPAETLFDTLTRLRAAQRQHAAELAKIEQDNAAKWQGAVERVSEWLVVLRNRTNHKVKVTELLEHAQGERFNVCRINLGQTGVNSPEYTLFIEQKAGRGETTKVITAQLAQITGNVIKHTVIAAAPMDVFQENFANWLLSNRIL